MDCLLLLSPLKYCSDTDVKNRLIFLLDLDSCVIWLCAVRNVHFSSCPLDSLVLICSLPIYWIHGAIFDDVWMMANRESQRRYFWKIHEQDVHPQVGAKRDRELPTSCEGLGNEECKSLFCTASAQHSSRLWQGRVFPLLFHTLTGSCHVDKADMSRKI